VANREQRRRREKEKRHDYEIVYVDDEGNELEAEEVEARVPARKEPPARRSSSTSKASGSSRSRGRIAQPPSWQRSIKRGALFIPIFIAALLLLNRKNGSLAGALISAVFLLVVFVPFSYFLDSLLWRSHLKRLGQGPPAKR
jgi:hypothetical protein